MDNSKTNPPDIQALQDEIRRLRTELAAERARVSRLNGEALSKLDELAATLAAQSQIGSLFETDTSTSECRRDRLVSMVAELDQEMGAVAHSEIDRIEALVDQLERAFAAVDPDRADQNSQPRLPNEDARQP